MTYDIIMQEVIDEHLNMKELKPYPGRGKLNIKICGKRDLKKKHGIKISNEEGLLKFSLIWIKKTLPKGQKIVTLIHELAHYHHFRINYDEYMGINDFTNLEHYAKRVKREKVAFEYTYKYLKDKKWKKKDKLLNVFFNILKKIDKFNTIEDIGSGTKMIEHHVKAARLFLESHSSSHNP